MLRLMSHPSLFSVATFNGLQETPNCAPWFAVPVPLWTLTQPVRGLLVGSTYAERTLRNAVLAEEAERAVLAGTLSDALPLLSAKWLRWTRNATLAAEADAAEAVALYRRGELTWAEAFAAVCECRPSARVLRAA